MPAPRRLLALSLLALSVLVATGCGRAGQSSTSASGSPQVGVKGAASSAAQDALATKNTVRIGGGDPVANAAAAARAVYPGASLGLARPTAVALADVADWRGALAASVLMASPLGAPLLFSDGSDVPGATADALKALRPTGAKSASGAQVVRIGAAAQPDGVKTVDVVGDDPYTLARSIDAFSAAARGKTSDHVLVVSADDPAYAMPAAAWAAKSGDPILFVTRTAVPAPTISALQAHQQPKIYVLGPKGVVSQSVVRQLKKLGTVTRIAGPDPAASAVAFARFHDAGFGWGITDPGHGFVFAAAGRPLDAAAGAPLSAAGTYGPLLVIPGPPPVTVLPAVVRSFLLDVQPGYTNDPVRGVYNRAWIVGDDHAISLAVQSQIDQLLEIVPVTP